MKYLAIALATAALTGAQTPDQLTRPSAAVMPARAAGLPIAVLVWLCLCSVMSTARAP